MGRNIPMEEIPSNHHHYYPSLPPPIYPALKLSFHVAWMVVLIAIIGGLCGNRAKKTPSPEDDQATDNAITDEKVTEKATTDEKATADADVATATDSSLQSPLQTTNNTTEDQEETQKPLPPPPAVVALELGGGDGDKKRSPPPHIDRSSTLHSYMSKNASRRMLSGSISMRIPGAKSVRQRVGEVKEDAQKKLSLKQEDSIWQKKILLGEKCRLQSDDDDGGGGGAGGGNVVSQAGSLQSGTAMSRSNSLIKDDAVSSRKGENFQIESKEREGNGDD